MLGRIRGLRGHGEEESSERSSPRMAGQPRSARARVGEETGRALRQKGLRIERM